MQGNAEIFIIDGLSGGLLLIIRHSNGIFLPLFPHPLVSLLAAGVSLNPLQRLPPLALLIGTSFSWSIIRDVAIPPDSAFLNAQEIAPSFSIVGSGHGRFPCFYCFTHQWATIGLLTARCLRCHVLYFTRIAPIRTEKNKKT